MEERARLNRLQELSEIDARLTDQINRELSQARRDMEQIIDLLVYN